MTVQRCDATWFLAGMLGILVVSGCSESNSSTPSSTQTPSASGDFSVETTVDGDMQVFSAEGSTLQVARAELKQPEGAVSMKVLKSTTARERFAMPAGLVLREDCHVLQLLPHGATFETAAEATIACDASLPADAEVRYLETDTSKAWKSAETFSCKDKGCTLTLAHFSNYAVFTKAMDDKGGTLSNDAGDALDVPAGALSEAQTLTLTRQSDSSTTLPALPDGLTLRCDATALSATDTDSLSFAQAANLSLNCAGETDDSCQVLHLTSAAATEWQVIDAQCNAEDATLSITAGGFYARATSACVPQAEVCDGVDNDCDGVIDNGLATTTWYRDVDNDGFGDPNATLERCGSTAPQGFVADNTDCGDSNDEIFPGAPKTCGSFVNNIDIDCDGVEEPCLATCGGGSGNVCLPVPPLPDSDGDGAPDFLDSDGDGIKPVGEVKCVASEDPIDVDVGSNQCLDGIDNDCDGLVDAQDPDCQ